MKTTNVGEIYGSSEFLMNEEQRLKEENYELKKRMLKMINTVNKYWSFDNRQQHTHSWHDKQDCIEKLRALAKF